MPELSILIPARNEMFLAKTVENILENIEADTEIIVVLDGKWADPAIPQHPRVNVVYLAEAIGQRAATNLACRLSKAKYVIKTDAHCAFDKGFDRKMLDAFKVVGDDVTMVPVMKNLWAFDWKCYGCGWKRYQSPTPIKCPQCNGTNIKRVIRWKTESKKGDTAIGQWKRERSPESTSYCFDSEPHFQYFEEWKHRPEYRKSKEETGFTESMSLQGSFFMLTREKYWELNICDEQLGNWGNQGIEVAVKTWLSGGRVLCNHKTWYAHMFRTQGGDFGFPYKLNGNDVSRTKKKVKDLFFNNKWPHQKHPLSWLLDKFWPVKGWSQDDLNELKKV